MTHSVNTGDMRRLPPEQRLPEVAAAAMKVFRTNGYRRTLMADVAAELKLSPGALYTYVESKEALFYLVFAHAFGTFGEGAPPLPLATPRPGETVELIRAGLTRENTVDRLRAALARDHVDDVRAEVIGIIEERYDMIERVWPLLALVERSAPDLPDLAEQYYSRGRRRLHDLLVRYIEKRIAGGYFRPVPDAVTAGRYVIESVTWFAWHRREDPDASTISDAAARETVIDLLTAAFVKER
ncbi:MAG TPA: helix-turn-helix domain-containing protein [Acidimicrobiales bacterium]|nr:helix-turn-helix domain-containing protein [Acidimicrobiales bacterium]